MQLKLCSIYHNLIQLPQPTEKSVSGPPRHSAIFKWPMWGKAWEPLAYWFLWDYRAETSSLAFSASSLSDKTEQLTDDLTAVSLVWLQMCVPLYMPHHTRIFRFVCKLF